MNCRTCQFKNDPIWVVFALLLCLLECTLSFPGNSNLSFVPFVFYRREWVKQVPKQLHEVINFSCSSGVQAILGVDLWRYQISFPYPKSMLAVHDEAREPNLRHHPLQTFRDFQEACTVFAPDVDLCQLLSLQLAPKSLSVETCIPRTWKVPCFEKALLAISFVLTVVNFVEVLCCIESFSWCCCGGFYRLMMMILLSSRICPSQVFAKAKTQAFWSEKSGEVVRKYMPTNIVNQNGAGKFASSEGWSFPVVMEEGRCCFETE